MQGAAIDALNEGLQTFMDDLIKTRLLHGRLDSLSRLTDVNVVQDFVTAEDFEPPTLTARGLHIGAAIHKALEPKPAKPVSRQVAYYRPWIFMITDGEPKESQRVLLNKWRNVLRMMNQ